MNFEIEKALKREPISHDADAVQQADVKATIYKSNQVLLLDMKAGSTASHDQENCLVNIEVIEGSVILEFANSSHELSVNSEERGAFSIPTPYTLAAKVQAKLLIFARSSV